jgi:hypothetical protein
VAANVTNFGGTVKPGTSPGTLTIGGDYTQGSSGRLEMEIAGTAAGSFDRLIVSARATVGGTLEIKPVGGFTPASSDIFSFVQAGTTRTGTFSHVEGRPSAGNGHLYLVQYNALSVSLAVIPSPPSCTPDDTITWVGGTGAQSWHVATNWSDAGTGDARSPGGNDRVCISTTGAAVQHTTGLTTIQTVDVRTGATLALSGGSTLSLTDTSHPSVVAALTQGTSTITGPGDITITGSLAQGAGTMSGTGRTTIASGASWSVNAGTLSRTLEIRAGGSGVAATFFLGAGGAVANGGSLTLNGNVVNTGVPASLTNTGSLLHPASTTNTIGVPFANSGTVAVSAGSLSLDVASTSTGAYQVGAGATLAFKNGAHTFAAGTAITGDGTVLIHGGTATLEDDTTLDVRSITVNGAATFRADDSFIVGRLTVTSSTLTGVGSLTVREKLDQSGSTLSFVPGFNPGVFINAGATWMPSGVNTIGRDIYLRPGATATIKGTLNLTLGQITNHGTITFPSGTALVSGGLLRNEADGLLVKGGSGTASIGRLANDGEVQVNAGKVDVTGRLDNLNSVSGHLVGGTFKVKGTLALAGGPVLQATTALTLDGAAARVIDRTTNASGLLRLGFNAGELAIINGAKLDASQAAFFSNSGTIRVGASSRLVAVELDVNAFGLLQGLGTVEAARVVVNSGGTVAPGDPNGANGVLTITGRFTQNSGGSLEIDVSGGGRRATFDRLVVGGVVTLDGTLRISTAATFSPAVGDTFRIAAGSSRVGTFATVLGTGISSGKRYTVDYGANDATLRVIFTP